MTDKTTKNLFELEDLRQAIQGEYSEVAQHPEKGFHFHTGRPLAAMLDYKEAWLDGIPEDSIESFAGTGNPFSLGELKPGDNIVDVGSGAGLDSLIAGRKVGPNRQVIGIDMTAEMLDKARKSAGLSGISNVEYRQGYGEDIPVQDGWADVIISNGVLNLMPDKTGALQEMARVLKPDGRLQIADIIVQREVPISGKRQIDLWTG